MPDLHRLRIREVTLLERPVRLRLPFRYGAVTLREAPEAFARVVVECPGGRACGGAAEMLAPKWFDKDPRLSDADDMDQLRRSLARAADAYRDAPPANAFDHALAVRGHVGRGRNGLVDGFGPAVLERAVLDAVGRIAGAGFPAMLRANLPGIRLGALAPDLDGVDTATFLAGLAAPAAIDARHTVGLLDALGVDELGGERVDDGLPESLDEVVARYGNRWFKVKIGGDVDADLDRLRRVAATLERLTGGRYRVTLDGNEQYADAAALAALLEAFGADPALEGLRRALAFIEQPVRRDAALAEDLAPLRCPYPLVIDESDDAIGAFPAARAMGYSGVSSKQCKGLYKSLANAARCALWNAQERSARYFMTGEDLTCQGGVAVQQDLALAAALGVTHVERNGHHFAGPMPGAPQAEHRRFRAAHPDLYEPVGDRAGLRIHGGRIALASLYGCTGFAHAADPEFASMTPMRADFDD